MSDDADDTTGSRPSLEAPRLFGRRRPKAKAAPAPEPEPEPEPETVEVVVDEPAFEDSGHDLTAPLPAVDETTVIAEPVPSAEPERRPKATTRAKAQVLDPDPDPEPAAEVDPDDEAVDEEPARRTPQRPALPALPALPDLSGRVAAGVTGVVVGLALVGLTWLGFRGCELVRGTSSCGTAPGMLALGLIFVLSVVVGGMLLARFGVPDPGSTSFLGTGLTGVACLLFLVDHLDAWPMVLVIPALTAVTFLLSWWVTTTYVDAE